MSLVKRISRESMSFDGFIVTDGTSIIDAIKKLNTNKVIVFVVSNSDRRLLGSITDGDVRRALLKGKNVDEPVTSIMQSRPSFIKLPALDHDCLHLMQSNTISSLPVLDDLMHIHELVFIEEKKDHSHNINDDFKKEALIMAGGFGTRLMPLTKDCPKPMLKVDGKPLLELIINNLKNYGYSKIYISVHYLANQIKEYFKDGSDLDIEIEYLYEDKPLGTAGCLDSLRKKINNSFLVMNGDIITSIDFDGLLSFHLNQKSNATMVVRPQEIKSEFGIVSTDDLEITGFKEKPVYVSYINTGIYILSPDIFNYLDGRKKDMPDLFLDMKKNGLKTIAYPMHEDWRDIGNIDQYNKLKNEKI